MSWRRFDKPGADRLTGKGVYYGAAPMPADECADERMIIVGAGNSAGQAALDLASKGALVTIVARCRNLSEKMSQYLVERIKGPESAITVRESCSVVRCDGAERLESVLIRDDVLGVEEVLPARYLMVFIGALPNTEWLGELVARDAHGFILTGTDLTPAHLTHWPLQRAPTLFETSVPGIYAAGDVRHDSIKRVASAVGEGSVVVHFVHRHLASF